MQFQSAFSQFLFIVVLILGAGCARPNLQDASDSGNISQLDASKKCVVLNETTQETACAQILLERQLTAKSFSSFRFYFTNLDRFYIAKPFHKVELVLWMPSMGHGSAPAKVADLGSGQYMATNVFFIMSGEWELWFKIVREENQEAVVIKLPVRIP